MLLLPAVRPPVVLQQAQLILAGTAAVVTGISARAEEAAAGLVLWVPAVPVPAGLPGGQAAVVVVGAAVLPV